MTEACNTRCESATHIGADQCKFSRLIEVLIVHIMDKVQRVYINPR